MKNAEQLSAAHCMRENDQRKTSVGRKTGVTVVANPGPAAGELLAVQLLSCREEGEHGRNLFPGDPRTGSSRTHNVLAPPIRNVLDNAGVRAAPAAM